MKVIYPKVKSDSESRIYIEFYKNNKRYRLFNGSKINSEIHPNSYPVSERMKMGNLLASEVYQFFMRLDTLSCSKVKPLTKN